MVRSRVDVRQYDRTRGGRAEHVRDYSRMQDLAAHDPTFSALGRRNGAPLERLSAVDYMELKPGHEKGFSCGACAFFDKGFCKNNAIQTTVRANGCCNLFYPSDPDQLTYRARNEEAIWIGDAIGVDWSVVDREQFTRGIEVEREHADVAKDDLDFGRIALAHLKEVPDYYTKLAKYVEV